MSENKMMEKALESLEDEIKNINFKILFLDSSVPVLVPEDISVELQLRIVAAVKSYLLGVKSMDRTYKRYKDSWEAQIERWEYDGRLS